MNDDLIQFSYQDEDEEQQKMNEIVSPRFKVNQEYFSFVDKNNNEEYKDKLIKELIERNNELEQFTSNYHQLLQRNKMLEQSIEAKDKELSMFYENNASDFVNQINQLNLKISELNQKNQILTARMESKELKSSNQEIDISRMKQLINKLGGVIQNLKNRQKESVVKEYIDKFVSTTIQLDEIYYQLLSNLDEQSIQPQMQKLEMLSSKRKMFLEKVYIELQEI